MRVTCLKLETLLSSNINEVNINHMVSNLDDSLRSAANPLSQSLPLQSINIFIDVIEFAIRENKELLFTILKLTTTGKIPIDEKAVIFSAKLFMDIASRTHSNSNVFKKLKAVVLQVCGLNHTGIDILSQMGESESHRSLIDTRTELAIRDEEAMKTVAAKQYIAVVIDNIDTVANKVLQHQTLPVLLCRDIYPFLDGLNTVSPSLMEAHHKITSELLFLDSPSNREEKQAIIRVTSSVLAHIASDIPDFKVLSKLFPMNHDHEFSEVMKQKTLTHIEPVIDLSEMETANMVNILQQLSTRYLELLCEKLSGDHKESFMNAVHDMRSGNVSLERLREAEKCVMDVVMEYGKLLIIGDQLTVSRALKIYVWGLRLPVVTIPYCYELPKVSPS